MAPDQQTETMARYVRVTVVDHATEGGSAVTSTILLGVATWGLQMAQTFSPDTTHATLDWDSRNALVQEGTPGEIVHVDDEVQRKTIDVWVE